jgi:hypothetical protein
MKDVVDKQIPELDSNQDAIMLSIGGNDAGLINLLNSCISRWVSSPHSKPQPQS